jgi:hypothetical protein
MLLLALLTSKTSIAVPSALQAADAGVVDGIVVQAGTSMPVSNAQVTLSGGAIKSSSLEKLSEQLQESASVPDSMVGVRNYYMNSKGMTQQAAQESASKVMADGLKASPENGVVEDQILQNIMRYANVNFGTSPFNSEFGYAIKNFRSANADFKATTDRSGHFTMIGVPPGQYTIRAERDGYFGSGAVVPQTSSLAITIAPRQTLNVTVPMLHGATISGKLRDEAGLPIPTATVQAFAVAYANGLPSLRSAAAAKTNDYGEYSIFWLPAGEYLVAMVKDSTQVVGGSLLQQVVGTFYPGTPVVTEALPVNVKGGENLEGLDFTQRITKPIRISGSIVTTLPPPQQPAANALNPAAVANNANQTRNAALMLMQRDPGAPDDIGARTVGNVRVDVAKASGDFEVEVAPGTYDLFARMPLGGNGPVNVSFGRVAFDARDENVKGITINVDPVASLAGTLTVNGNPPGQNGIKVSVQVDDSGAKLPAYGINIRARTMPVDAAGNFNLPAVFVGHWQVFIEGLAAGMYVADVRQGGASVFDTGFDATGKALTPLQIAIRTDSAAISGSVVDGMKKPVANASIVLVPPDARRQNRLLYHTATADANGHFTISGIAPGNYKIFTWPGGDAGFFSNPIDGAYYNTKFMARYESRGQSINLASANNPVLELTVIPLD